MSILHRVFMVQVSTYRWQLETLTGKLIAEHLSFNNTHEAERWAKNYISSFNNWQVEVKPLMKVAYQ